jgi:hypothetical protein
MTELANGKAFIAIIPCSCLGIQVAGAEGVPEDATISWNHRGKRDLIFGRTETPIDRFI